MERSRFGRTLEYIRRCPYPVTLAYLFGSAAREQRTPLSDVDIAAYLDEPDRAQRAKIYPALLFDLRQVFRLVQLISKRFSVIPSGVEESLAFER
ncbi:MAG TPA: nucleotidyltransferase domain-containing protein [Armatimonadetes bacterium]|nr:nucleotidyltransferase domain-containing protein [Armatimonadota bacterium]